jgi:predicted transcriptional regulator
MERRNVTLSLRKDLLRKAKILAAREDTSMTAIMERLLEEHIARREGYEQARRRQTSALAEGFPLGTKGKARWTREELHERR